MTAKEWAAIVAEAVGLHNGDFPAQWAKDTELTIANAVGKAEQAARAEEREACARLCETDDYPQPNLAKAIRGRP